MELNLETFDLREVIDELIGTVDALVRRNGNTLSVTFGAMLGSIQADLTKIRQILFNLLSNAAKFTNQGSVSLHIDRRELAGQEYFEFIVTDTGIGLTEEQRDKLFQPFVQADTSIARKYGGTGLGLALVWRYCQLMGGDVSVASPSGGGARFTVRLPVTVVERPQHASLPAA